MFHRRGFLAASGVGLVSVSAGWARRPLDTTWLTYAPDAELYWARLPFLDRLRKIAEAGFTRYEFGRWKTKDVDAIAKLNEELGIQATLFVGYPGLKGAKWKPGLLESGPDAAELAPRFGAVKVSLVANDRDEQVDRPEQVDELVDALKEVVEKVAEFETGLILETGRAVPNRPKPLISTVEEAAEVIKAVGSDRVKLAFPIDRADVERGSLPDAIKKHKDATGYYRLLDFGPPINGEEKYAQVLRAIHDVGHADPVGLGLASKADPSAAIELLRKLDATARSS